CSRRRRPVSPAVEIDRSQGTGHQDDTPAPATTRTVIVRRPTGICRPGVRADATTGVGGQSGERTGLCDHDDAATGAATPTAVLQGGHPDTAVRGDPPGPGHTTGTAR